MRQAFLRSSVLHAMAKAVALTLLTIICIGATARPLRADDSQAIPPPLQPWTQWVLDRTPDLRCPLIGEDRACIWPGRLSLSLNAKGGTFHSTSYLDHRGELALPGGGEVWPIDVVVDGALAKSSTTVVERDGVPVVVLSAGRHDITGGFSWNAMPKSLPLSDLTGIVDLELNGTKVESPKISENELWLQREEEGEQAEDDTLEVAVWRKLSDGLPFEVETRLELRISGKAREIALGNVLLAGSEPIDLSSDLAYKLDQSWNLTLQAKPGVHQIAIKALMRTPPEKLRAPALTVEGWPSDETWVFASNELFRSVELSGASGIDPNRTTLPDEWKSLPAYMVSSETELAFNETRRGEKDVPPNQVTLAREVWLDLDGKGYSIRDRLSGQMNKGWRLNVAAPTTLEQVTVDGQDQLITEDTSTKLSGVEVRSKSINLNGVSRIEGPVRSLPAVSWDHDVNSLQLDLFTPPGWSLLQASGADNDAGAWVSTWRLWDMFFVCLMAIAAAKLLGFLCGLVALAALVLCHGQPGAPVYIWINLLAAKALLDVLPENRFRNVIRAYLVLSFMLLASVLLPFAIDQVRLGLFPQLHLAFRPGEVFAFIIGPTLGFCSFAAFVAFVVCLFQRRFRNGFLMLLLSGGLLVLSVMVVGILATSSYSRYDQFQSYTPTAPAPIPQSDGGAIPQGEVAMSYDAEQNAPAEMSISAPRMKALSRAPKEEGYLEANALQQKLLQVDPKAIVQTGVAVPNWSWRAWPLRWNGPVTKDQTLTLYLLSPRWNCALSFLRVLLLTALALAFVSFSALRAAVTRIAPALLLLSMLQPDFARAQSYPQPELLTELEQRMTKDLCKSDCTIASSMAVDLSAGQVTFDVKVSSDGPGAWPLPGPVEEFHPSSVTLDGQPVTEFRRGEDGLAWIRIPAGTHSVAVRGGVSGRTELTLQLGIVPKHVEVRSSDWAVDGLTPTGSAQESIQFIRKAESLKNSPVAAQGRDELPLADWYAVERELSIALPWTVRTTVKRLGQSDRSQLVRVPLLHGESVTESATKVEGGSALVTFPRGENAVSWTSSLEQEPTLKLTALSGQAMTETWKMRCSAIWRCETSGILPLSSSDTQENVVTWLPFPGESVQISVMKPLGASGRTRTIDNAALEWDPGSGLMRGSLTYSIRASQGGFQKVTLPDGASIESVTIKGVQKTILPEGRVLSLPLTPGQQTINVAWRQPWDSQMFDRMPEVNLGESAGNVNIRVRVPEKRWLLYARGPEWGPAVLFWGELIVVVVFGLILGRLRIQPLSTFQWILLGLGMATLHPAFMLLPAVCFVALNARRRLSVEKPWFNFAQLGLALLCLITFLFMFGSIYNGLIVDPDMGVSGANSTNSLLNWYIDRSSASLPTPQVISAPLWCWRLLMLLWSSWLVFALLRWLKWGWESFSSGGVWRTKTA
ncbi:MAG: hypothetical protein U0136_17820 [Bdellovibrionota bacterium]